MKKVYLRVLFLLLVSMAPVAEAGGGFVFWTGEITDNTVHTVLPAGTIDTTAAEQNGVHIRIGINPSTGASTLTSTSLRYGLSTALTQDSVTFEVETDGSFTIQRTAGSKTYFVVVRGIWVG